MKYQVILQHNEEDCGAACKACDLLQAAALRYRAYIMSGQTPRIKTPETLVITALQLWAIVRT